MDGKHALVRLSTVRPGYIDQTCILEPGEHPFVKAQTFVNYQRAEIYQRTHIDKCISGWLYTPREPMANDVMARIVDGVTASIQTPRKVKKYLAALIEQDFPF
jgi:hypothetical protein